MSNVISNNTYKKKLYPCENSITYIIHKFGMKGLKEFRDKKIKEHREKAAIKNIDNKPSKTDSNIKPCELSKYNINTQSNLTDYFDYYTNDEYNKNFDINTYFLTPKQYLALTYPDEQLEEDQIDDIYDDYFGIDCDEFSTDESEYEL